jgi:hypothetical protein
VVCALVYLQALVFLSSQASPATDVATAGNSQFGECGITNFAAETAGDAIARDVARIAALIIGPTISAHDFAAVGTATCIPAVGIWWRNN